MTLSKLPGQWRWEDRGERGWWRILDQDQDPGKRIEDGPHHENWEMCPLCGADMRAGGIPLDIREHYGTKTHYSKVIGHEVQGEDRISSWSCPDCGGSWPR